MPWKKDLGRSKFQLNLQGCSGVRDEKIMLAVVHHIIKNINPHQWGAMWRMGYCSIKYNIPYSP